MRGLNLTPIFIGSLAAACSVGHARPSRELPDTRTIVVYDSASIDPTIAIWNPRGIDVGGYRHANVFVEFQQRTSDEPPLEVGVGFAPWQNGRVGTRSYYDFTGPVTTSPSASFQRQPTWISGSGENTWHGEQGISSYLIRVPVMGPYMWIYPQNNHSQARKFTIVVYLTKH